MNKKSYYCLVAVFATLIVVSGAYLCFFIIHRPPHSARTREEVLAKIQRVTDIEAARRVLISDDTYIRSLERIIAVMCEGASYFAAVSLFFGIAGIAILVKARARTQGRVYPSDGANAALGAPRSSS